MKTVVLLGDGGVGKSAISIQYTQHHFSTQYDPTIENTYRKQVTVDDKTHMIQILDTAGQEEYRMMTDQYIRSADGVILVCSLTSMESLNELEVFKRRIDMVKEDCIYTFPLVIAANKSDVMVGREISETDLTSKGTEWNAEVVQCSAKTRINIDTLFEVMIRRMCPIVQNEDQKKNIKKPKQCKIL